MRTKSATRSCTSKNKSDVRDEEVHQTILEQEGHKLRAAALDADEALVGAEAEDEEVEAHGVDESGRKDGVVRLRDDTALTGDPHRVEEDT